MIYLDNASTSFPKPACVYKATSEILRSYCANPGRSGHDLAQRCAEEIYDAFMKKEELLSEKLCEMRALKERLLSLRLSSLSYTDKSICIFEDGCDSGLLRKLVNDGLHLTGKLFAAFSAREVGGYAYVIGTKVGDLAPLAKDISASLGGRGGGTGPMITGYVESDEEKIKEYFEK